MSTETEIQTEVDALKARFEDTKTLYREVCALLFFRYGITPTANKLYQFVRRGSMSAPADALNKFWEDLRTKSRVDIDRPDLPDELKVTAAEAIASIWRQATAAARDELAALRADANAEVARLQGELDQAKQEVQMARGSAAALKADVEKIAAARDALRTELETEQRGHAASAARIHELQRQHEELRAEQVRLREGFSADLAKTREAVTQANERADASERRALLEVDKERQARIAASKQVDTLKAEKTVFEAKAREAETASATTIDGLRASLSASEAGRASAGTAHEGLREALSAAQVELQSAKEDLIRSQAQAATLQGMLDRLDVRAADPPKPAAPRPPREPKRKS